MSLAAGVQLGPYEIGGLVGAGGMGEVYRARDPRLGREVAVKVLPAEVASDSARLGLFEREARAVAALSHPNILTVHDVGTHEGTPYVVTELLEGETLRELVSRRTPTIQQILIYMLQAARGLETAHTKGIVHRDLKPENLFLTTDGRVKVLDFGLAKLLGTEAEITSEVSTAAQSTPPGQVAGTVLYMSPEQARALPIDPRSDVFSFGVVLYELLAGRHPFRRDTLAGTLTAIVDETPADLESLGRGVPPSVAGIVRRCLEKDRDDRYTSGREVVVALDTVLAAPSAAAALREVEERSPYPGLSSFTEKDASVFYGREREVEEVWVRIRSRTLLAVIGPSGAGKTSFVRAGVLPARPEGWAALECTPGSHPFRALGQALGPELAGDTEALGKLVGLDDPDTAVELFGRWRGRHGEALLVVDQFEELITLSPPEVQTRFARLLGRLASHGDVHVVLSLRDDFLIRCVEHESLAPVLEGLTALLALKPEDLRRAIEEPARKRGYRFEDAALVDEMVESVEGARAALPLLAFAVSRLWEKRDREKKVLTRAAYEEIGGVAGALAQHAEQTMDRIGSERQGMVREIFRNLVTSQGTRAVADREELLSVFPERVAAEQVLAQLVDARLLTSYEVEDSPPSSRGGQSEAGDERSAAAATHRIEIAHESLLKAWPRLVRWQAQDEEGAVLRDQLKQAAHVWEERGRSPDVLWSGTALREYELWRERYAGKLTGVEESFAGAMLERDRRRRRWRHAAVAAVIATLATVAVVVSVSRHEAVRQTRMAQAAELVAIGRNELERYPAAALAYARESLEVADTAAGRRLAVAAPWSAPPLRILPLEADSSFRGTFSPDGRSLGVYTFSQAIKLFSEEGGEPHLLPGFVQPAGAPALWFTPDGRRLVATDAGARRFRMVSVDSGEERRRFEVGRFGTHACERSFTPVAEEGALLMGVTSAPSHQEEGTTTIVRWPYDGGAPRVVGAFPDATGAALDVAHGRLALVRGESVWLRPLEGQDGERLLGRMKNDDPLQSLAFSPQGDRLALGQRSGHLSVWELSDSGGEPRVLQTDVAQPEDFFPLAFDPSGRYVVWGSSTTHSASVWDVEGPPDAEPRTIRRSDGRPTQGLYHPSGRWLAAVWEDSVVFMASHQPRCYVLHGHERKVMNLGFTRDVSSLLSCAPGDGVFVWPLEPGVATGRRSFRNRGLCYGDNLPMTPSGEELLNCTHSAVLQPTSGGEGRFVYRRDPAEGAVLGGCAIDSTGRYAAVADQVARPPDVKRLRLLDLSSGEEIGSWHLAPPGESDEGYAWAVHGVEFVDRKVIAAGNGGVRSYDIDSGEIEWLWRKGDTTIAVSDDGSRLVALGVDEMEGLWSGGTRSELLLIDADGDHKPVLSHGSALRSVALDPTGRVLVTGDQDGVVRVGPVDGAEPALLMGHTAAVERVRVSPDSRWIASQAGTEIRLWRTPDLSKLPLHTLPYDELMAKLRSFTNLEVVEDEASSTGYRLAVGPFPGWKDVPEW